MKNTKKKKNWIQKHLFWSTIILIFIIGIIFGMIGGNKAKSNLNSFSKNKNAIPSYQIGESFNLGNFQYTINSVEIKSNLSSPFGVQKTKGAFLIVNLTLRNIGNKTKYMNHKIYALDSHGREFQSSNAYSLDVNDYLFPVANRNYKVKPGSSKTGELVFEVPRNISEKIGIKKNNWDQNFSAFIY